MKKSEFEAKRRERYTDVWKESRILQCLRDDVEAAEAACVVWDPEEEPLPEKIGVAEGSVSGRVELLPDGGTGLWPNLVSRAAAYAEAVRRYNAWPELEKLASKLPESPIHGDPCRFHCQLYHVQRTLRGGAQ